MALYRGMLFSELCKVMVSKVTLVGFNRPPWTRPWLR